MKNKMPIAAILGGREVKTIRDDIGFSFWAFHYDTIDFVIGFD
jgi:hypothetical protein